MRITNYDVAFFFIFFANFEILKVVVHFSKVFSIVSKIQPSVVRNKLEKNKLGSVCSWPDFIEILKGAQGNYRIVLYCS